MKSDIKQKIAALLGVKTDYGTAVYLDEKLPTAIVIDKINSWHYTRSVIKYRLHHPFGG